MFGKYYDTRVHPQYVRTYSRVPYLDTQIFNIQNQSLRSSRKTSNRAELVSKGLNNIRDKSNKIRTSLDQSKANKECDGKQFMKILHESQKNCLERQRKTWNNYQKQKTNNKSSYFKDQAYLDDLLKSNSTKAASRLLTVRRWN